MRNPKVKNKYNLEFADIEKLKIGDRNKICEPLFWRNNVVNAWCVSESTVKTPAGCRYGIYNDYWIGIYDTGEIDVIRTSYGGMCGYNFKKFFDFNEIENEMDLEIQEKLLQKINDLLDDKVLVR